MVLLSARRDSVISWGGKQGHVSRCLIQLTPTWKHVPKEGDSLENTVIENSDFI